MTAELKIKLISKYNYILLRKKLIHFKPNAHLVFNLSNFYNEHWDSILTMIHSSYQSIKKVNGRTFESSNLDDGCYNYNYILRDKLGYIPRASVYRL